MVWGGILTGLYAAIVIGLIVLFALAGIDGQARR